jgi:hypothetical protein
MALTYQELSRFADTSAAITLLRGDDYVEDIAFLNQTFRGEGNVVVAESELRTLLARWLDVTFDAEPDKRPNWEPGVRIGYYVKQGFLRKREPADHSEPVYELTSDVDRVLGWVEDQRRREFVGTEYGLQAIMRDLREVAARASGDVEKRIANLKTQRTEIQREIDLLSEHPEKAQESNGRYIVETVQRLERASQHLVGDFSDLRERFTDLARDVAREQGSGSFRRGDILRLALDGEDALRHTPMGESFYGFWRLIASSERDEFVAMVRAVYATPGMPQDIKDRRVLLGLLDRLREQGQVVLDANRQLTRHVRRALDREEIETRRLMASRVHDLQLLLLGHQAEIGEVEGITVDERVHLGLAIDRPLYDPPEPVIIDTVLKEGAHADIREAAKMIASAGVVNFGRLVAGLDAELAACQARGLTGLLLSTHLQNNPPRSGVLDLLGYLHLGRMLDGDAEVMEHKPFVWKTKATRHVSCPDIFFLSVKKLLPKPERFNRGWFLRGKWGFRLGAILLHGSWARR